MRNGYIAAMAVAALWAAPATAQIIVQASSGRPAKTEPATPPMRFKPIAHHQKVDIFNQAGISVTGKDILKSSILTPLNPADTSNGRQVLLSGSNTSPSRSMADGGSLGFAERKGTSDSYIELSLTVPGAQRYLIDCYFDAALSEGKDILFSYSDKTGARIGVQIAAGRTSVITPRISSWSPPVVRLRPNYVGQASTPVRLEGCEITPLAK